MLERWKKGLDNGKVAGAVLTDLSKAFDCLHHEWLIAKLQACGFDDQALSYVYSYLSDRNQRTKVNGSFCVWSDIVSGVPQGSILGPLLFNIYLNDIFYFTSGTEITNYVDDTTPYTIKEDIELLIGILQNDISIIIKWFQDNYFKLIADKCHFLVPNHGEDLFIKVEEDLVQSSKSVKLLGVMIDNKLNFNAHVSNICRKASLKLHALARVSHYMNREKLRLII